MNGADEVRTVLDQARSLAAGRGDRCVSGLHIFLAVLAHYPTLEITARKSLVTYDTLLLELGEADIPVSMETVPLCVLAQRALDHSPSGISAFLSALVNWDPSVTEHLRRCSTRMATKADVIRLLSQFRDDTAEEGVSVSNKNRPTGSILPLDGFR